MKRFSVLQTSAGRSGGELSDRLQIPRLLRRGFYGACSVQSSSALRSRHLSIFCAIEMACHRPGMFLKDDRVGVSSMLN